MVPVTAEQARLELGAFIERTGEQHARIRAALGRLAEVASPSGRPVLSPAEGGRPQGG